METTKTEYPKTEKDAHLRESSLSQAIPADNPVDLSFGAILKGNAANPLTLFEKKAGSYSSISMLKLCADIE